MDVINAADHQKSLVLHHSSVYLLVSDKQASLSQDTMKKTHPRKAYREA
jgi:hypothetical protein